MIETPPRILVVEDVALIRTIYDITFAEVKAAVAPDLVVEFAVDGREAIERMARTPPIDLLLLDLFMPGVDGLEVGKAARASTTNKDTRILIFTASDKTEASRAMQSLGASGVIAKPVEIEDLIKKAEALFKG